MRVIFIIMLERNCTVNYRCFHIRLFHERDIITFHRAPEAFCHYIALGTAHRRRVRLQVKLSAEPSGFMRNIRRTIVRQPLDAFFGQPASEPLFYRARHHILHRGAVVASRAGGPVYGFPVAAVQRERDPQFIAVVTPELKAV